MANKKKMGRFRVIGACTTLQTISWEEENKLIGGIPYDIDLFQDPPNIYLDGLPIKGIPTNDIVKAINLEMDAEAYEHNGYVTMSEEYFAEEFTKVEERERKWMMDKKETEKRKKELWNEYFSFLGMRR